MQYSRELLKGNTEALLLSILAREPRYGYQMVKEIGQISGGYFHFREGTLYPALHRLENDGLVRGEWQTSPAGMQRRYYHITEKGRRSLARLSKEWASFSRAMNLVVQQS